MARRRYELTDHEWSIIEPLLPNKPRGVPRVDDRRVLNGILWRFAFSVWVYRQRNLVERFFNKIKHFRGIATRYDKDPRNFLAAVKLVALRIWCAA